MPSLSPQILLTKKRDGKDLTEEEVEYFVRGLQNGEFTDTQTGAMLMACHLRGVSDPEIDHLMRAMMTSGATITWPETWMGTIGSLQSTGSSGNKAKLILAPAMAACGLRFPIMSARGYDAVGGILSKLKSIEGFEGDKSMRDIQKLLESVGCCVISQPPEIAPAETLIRDKAAEAATGEDYAFKEACMIARVAALRLRAVVIEIAYGPGEWIKNREDASKMAKKLEELSGLMGMKTRILLTRVEWPVGRMIGSALEVAEAVKIMNGSGPQDLHELVCKLGGHVLHATGLASDPQTGQDLVHKRIKDGSTKKKFGEMLKAQGVFKDDVKSLLKVRKDEFNISSVLPVAKYFTHLSLEGEGYIHGIDLTKLNEVVYELTTQDTTANKCPATGIQLLVTVGTLLKKGDVWAKIHHNIRLTALQTQTMRESVTLKPDKPEVHKLIHVEVYTQGSLKRIQTSPLINNTNLAGGADAHDDVFEPLEEIPEEQTNGHTTTTTTTSSEHRAKTVTFSLAESTSGDSEHSDSSLQAPAKAET